MITNTYMRDNFFSEKKNLMETMADRRCRHLPFFSFGRKTIFELYANIEHVSAK